ncbi:MAG: phosphotransferase [Gammaproteobacteria bacterium]|nr:phosphotransferase [Gammaproteobacteria bacterium]
MISPNAPRVSRGGISPSTARRRRWRARSTRTIASTRRAARTCSRSGRAAVIPTRRHSVDAVLQHLAERAPHVTAPRPVPAVDGRTFAIDESDGPPLLLRCLTWIDGTPWAASAVDPLDGPYSLGEYLARLDRALEDFDEGRADRELAWDMRAAGRHADSLALVEPPAVHERVAKILERFEREVVGELLRLPAQLIHNDANDHNIIMGDDGRVRSVIDFGDAVRGQRVTEIAVACAYAMCGSADPFRVAARIVAGYHSVSPLDARELALIPDLVETRAAMSFGDVGAPDGRRPRQRLSRGQPAAVHRPAGPARGQEPRARALPAARRLRPRPASRRAAHRELAHRQPLVVRAGVRPRSRRRRQVAAAGPVHRRRACRGDAIDAVDRRVHALASSVCTISSIWYTALSNEVYCHMRSRSFQLPKAKARSF